MAAISQQLADITVLSIVVRILLSTFCAGTLGFERERHNQAAGFRTYIIVSDASALVMMTNIFVAGIGETDLVRMSASVITGLGFLGAGTILVTRNQEMDPVHIFPINGDKENAVISRHFSTFTVNLVQVKSSKNKGF